jgi:O-antigen ligase
LECADLSALLPAAGAIKGGCNQSQPPLITDRPPISALKNISRSSVSGAIVFYSLLALIALAAIPYGTIELGWKAFFDCVVFALAALTVLLQLFASDNSCRSKLPSLFVPVLALMAFAIIQTIPWTSSTVAGITVGQTLSADPFHTRQFAVQLFALLLIAWLLLVHTTTARRLRLLCDVVIAVGVVSAIFGLCRQASQTRPGFVLPYLLPGFGYGQFINSNHFAFLMEMAVGLALGLVIFRGVTGKRLAIYLIAAVPMWVALVFANSRGGILSMLCQVMFLAAAFVSQREVPERANLSRTRRLMLRAGLVATLVLGAVVTIVFVGGDPLAGRIGSLSVELDRKTAETYTLRPNIWRATWEMIKDHPVAGTGFGSYWVAITEYHRGSGEASPQEAHSDYLELLASGGLIGLALGAWAAFAFIRTALREVHENSRYLRAAKFGALAGIVAVAVHSLVDFGLHLTINAAVFVVLITIVVISGDGLPGEGKN